MRNFGVGVAGSMATGALFGFGNLAAEALGGASAAAANAAADAAAKLRRAKAVRAARAHALIVGDADPASTDDSPTSARITYYPRTWPRVRACF